MDVAGIPERATPQLSSVHNALPHRIVSLEVCEQTVDFDPQQSRGSANDPWTPTDANW